MESNFLLQDPSRDALQEVLATHSALPCLQWKGQQGPEIREKIIEGTPLVTEGKLTIILLQF